VTGTPPRTDYGRRTLAAVLFDVGGPINTEVEPEAAVSALVFYYPDAAYFSTGPAGDDPASG
jgi:hypothetical protein